VRIFVFLRISAYFSAFRVCFVFRVTFFGLKIDEKKIFKDSYKENAVKALRKIHLRACYDLMPEIILSANALLQTGILIMNEKRRESTRESTRERERRERERRERERRERESEERERAKRERERRESEERESEERE
jgi:Hyccin